MTITNFHLPYLSVLLALFTILVAKTCFSVKTFEFVEHFLDSKKGDTIKGLDQVRQYLIKFGYMNSISSNNQRDEFDDILTQSVKKYQQFFHLNSSGVLDAKTLDSMAMPRCGVPDFQFASNGSYYAFLRSKWSNFNLTWGLVPGPRKYARAPIADALEKWASVSKFHFRPGLMYYLSDLKFGFFHRDHGDGSPFDGPTGVLAHSWPPPNGNCHFDDEERWVTRPFPGHLDTYNIGTIALHEIGHLLGLAHTNVPSTIMFPKMPLGGAVKGLDPDDIARIRALYP